MTTSTVFRFRLTDRPDDWMTMIVHERMTVAQATDALKWQFGAVRVLEVTAK